MMKKWFQADLYFDRIHDITPEILKKHGICSVLVDLDNTLADYDTLSPTEQVRAWIDSLRAKGVAVAIVSNNNKARVEEYCKDLEIPYFWRSAKPCRGAILRAMDAISAKAKSTALIGDKKMTDVFGARRAHLFSIKVASIKPRGLKFKP